MGKIFSSVFGGSGSKQKSQQQSQSQSVSDTHSFNNAYPDLQKAYVPAINTGNESTDFISALLGLHGNPAANDAFDQYRKSNGYDFTMDQGTKAIENTAAGRGMLQSGATAKALQGFGQNTANQFFNSYLDKLFNLSSQGMQAGSLLSGAGQESLGKSTSNSTSSGSSKGSSYSKPGIASFLGKLTSAGAG